MIKISISSALIDEAYMPGTYSQIRYHIFKVVGESLSLQHVRVNDFH